MHEGAGDRVLCPEFCFRKFNLTTRQIDLEGQLEVGAQ